MHMPINSRDCLQILAAVRGAWGVSSDSLQKPVTNVRGACTPPTPL